MEQVISIADCLKRLEAGEVVTLEVYRYDRKREKGGRIDSFECVLLQNETTDEADSDDDGLPEEKSFHNTEGEALRRKRKPNHRFFYTRNVRIVANGHPTGVVEKIHPPLIRKFNGIKTVP